MICLASVAVLLGACSSTPDVKKQDGGDVQTLVKLQSLSKASGTQPVKQEKIAYVPKSPVPVPVNVTPVVKPKVITPTKTKQAVVKRKIVKRKVAKRKPVHIAKKPYVPPKPIVVAVHSAPKVVKKLSRPAAPRVTAPARVARKLRPAKKVVVASNQYQAVENLKLRRPSLPRASAAVVAGDPIFRPARVPTRHAKPATRGNAQYLAQQARAQQARAQQEQARAQQQLRARQAEQAQQLARAQWQKEQKALAYRIKWERDQRVKEQLQQSMIQQAQAQRARDQQAQQQAQAQWARDQQAQQQQARIQLAQAQQQRVQAQQAQMQQARIRQAQAKQQQARVQQAQARQQQARVQQASYRAPVRNAVLQRPANNYSQSRLTGDFAGNPRAEAFVRMMASRHGFDQSYVAGVLSRAEATPWLRKQAYKDANPTKRTRKSRGPSWSNYRRRFITSKHINTGTAFYHRHRGALQRAAAQYGVPEEYILGILGVETIFGGNVGSDRAIDALATLGFMNARRGKYFTSELESYFLETRRARLDPLKPKASWAGALGLPQFMPSNIKKYGVDFNGDGAVNLWTPQDAIGSVANYLRSHGWRPGEIAAIPAVKTGGRGYSNLKNGFKYKHSLAKLARNGLRPAYPGVSGMVNMVKLRTNRGNEYWVGGNNFYVITRYNHSSHYAMAVHQLAQEIRKRVKPGSSNSMPRVIEASNDQNLLRQAANTLL